MTSQSTYGRKIKKISEAMEAVGLKSFGNGSKPSFVKPEVVALDALISELAGQLKDDKKSHYDEPRLDRFIEENGEIIWGKGDRKHLLDAGSNPSDFYLRDIYFPKHKVELKNALETWIFLRAQHRFRNQRSTRSRETSKGKGEKGGMSSPSTLESINVACNYLESVPQGTANTTASTTRVTGWTAFSSSQGQLGVPVPSPVSAQHCLVSSQPDLSKRIDKRDPPMPSSGGSVLSGGDAVLDDDDDDDEDSIIGCSVVEPSTDGRSKSKVITPTGEFRLESSTLESDSSHAHKRKSSMTADSNGKKKARIRESPTCSSYSRHAPQPAHNNSTSAVGRPEQTNPLHSQEWAGCPSALQNRPPQFGGQQTNTSDAPTDNLPPVSTVALPGPAGGESLPSPANTTSVPQIRIAIPSVEDLLQFNPNQECFMSGCNADYCNHVDNHPEIPKIIYLRLFSTRKELASRELKRTQYVSLRTSKYDRETLELRIHMINLEYMLYTTENSTDEVMHERESLRLAIRKAEVYSDWWENGSRDESISDIEHNIYGKRLELCKARLELLSTKLKRRELEKEAKSIDSECLLLDLDYMQSRLELKICILECDQSADVDEEIPSS
ncbi:hypothetical protein K432DRAFT_410140 [Lepidopterella palustris CBS 459.81]|uniref:Uncharacterized protein n=1 Tax=Lepidopterella palustris CBS 459.81 TaxID=1314670 RepID=A0A8E2DYM0_9PEZI|nr:hypothetical protein K432DRAFT_410140 [Lepidopterella palustris CBS 459.81]